MSDGVTVLPWRADVDLDSVHRVRTEIDEVVGSARMLVLDLTEVEFVDSLGLGVLVHARNRCLAEGVTLVLRGMPEATMRLLTLSGLRDLFVFDNSVDGADGDNANSEEQPAPSPNSAQLPASTPLPATPDPAFDRLAALVHRVLDVPTALVSLVDRERQVFPGAVGLPEPWQQQRSTPLTHSFCQYVVAQEGPLVVDDVHQDALLVRNSAVPELGVVSYAGMPLTGLDGTVVGALCAIDSVPRAWSEFDLSVLSDLAAACSSELQAREAGVRAADAVEREDVTRDLNEHVVSDLFGLEMTLRQARSIAPSEVAELLNDAIDRIDETIGKIRRTATAAHSAAVPPTTD